MKIIITTKNLQMDEKIDKYVNQKIGMLKKLIKSCQGDEGIAKLRPVCEVFIELSRETKHHLKGLIFKAEGDVLINGKNLKAEVLGESIFEAIDMLKDEMQNEVKKYKEKSVDRERKQGRKFKEELRELPESEI